MLEHRRKAAPTKRQIEEMLSYCSETGLLYWRVNSRRYKENNPAGKMCERGYVRVSIEGIKYPAHQIIWLLIYGEWPHMDIDHIDGNRSNNSICNLRLATKAQNNANACLRKDNSSGYKGVSYHKSNKRYRAEIRHDGKRKLIGYFKTAQEASDAYCKEAIKLKGEFLCVNR